MQLKPSGRATDVKDKTLISSLTHRILKSTSAQPGKYRRRGFLPSLQPSEGQAFGGTGLQRAETLIPALSGSRLELPVEEQSPPFFVPNTGKSLQTPTSRTKQESSFCHSGIKHQHLTLNPN